MTSAAPPGHPGIPRWLYGRLKVRPGFHVFGGGFRYGKRRSSEIPCHLSSSQPPGQIVKIIKQSNKYFTVTPNFALATDTNPELNTDALYPDQAPKTHNSN